MLDPSLENPEHRDYQKGRLMRCLPRRRQYLKINYCAFLKVLLVFELAEMPAPLPGLVSLETWRMEVFGVDITRPPAIGPDIFFFSLQKKAYIHNEKH